MGARRIDLEQGETADEHREDQQRGPVQLPPPMISMMNTIRQSTGPMATTHQAPPGS